MNEGTRMVVQSCVIAWLEGHSFVDLCKDFETGRNKDCGTGWQDLCGIAQLAECEQQG